MENEIMDMLRQQQTMLTELQQQNSKLCEKVSNLENNISTYFETLHREMVDMDNISTEWLQAIRNELHNR